METTTQTEELVRHFVREYFDAWSGTDADAILRYYSDDIVLQLPRAKLEGKTSVLQGFVGPFIAAFPGNRHLPQSMAFADNLVAVEWIFQADHTGALGEIAPSGRRLNISGVSFYEYNYEKRVITAGRIYFAFEAFVNALRTRQ